MTGARQDHAPQWRIGCAGWSIPSAHGHLFGDGESHLARYATRFNVAGINSTFYRAHPPRTFERWAATVPGDVLFSVKLPRAISHEARLAGVGDALSAFPDQVVALGPTLGGAAAAFFGMLRRRTPLPVAANRAM